MDDSLGPNGKRDCRVTIRATLMVFAALLTAPASLRAAPTKPAAPTNADCLACHEDPSLEGGGGRKVAVAVPAFEASVHAQAGASCVDCHADLASATEFPHAEKLERVDCAACHSDAVAQYQASVHGRAQDKTPGGLAATCTGCHGPAHQVRSSKDVQSPTYHFNLPKTCGRCHGDAETIRKAGIEVGDVTAAFQDSIHAKALSESGLLVAPTCATCHGHHDIKRKTDEASRVFKQNVPGTCGSCHAGIKNRYDEGVHAAAVRSGNIAAAVCTDCHTAHGIQAAHLPSWRLEVAKECGTCHDESIRTYRDGFHGQASKLGYTRVATCADCHGAHDILPKVDPRSRVSPSQRLATCQQCHPTASVNFVKFDPHADPRDKERSAAVFYTARFMKILLGAVFAFFGVHTALWFPRELRARHRRAAGPGPGTDGEGSGAGKEPGGEKPHGA